MSPPPSVPGCSRRPPHAACSSHALCLAQVCCFVVCPGSRAPSAPRWCPECPALSPALSPCGTGVGCLRDVLARGGAAVRLLSPQGARPLSSLGRGGRPLGNPGPPAASPAREVLIRRPSLTASGPRAPLPSPPSPPPHHAPPPLPAGLAAQALGPQQGARPRNPSPRPPSGVRVFQVGLAWSPEGGPVLECRPCRMGAGCCV